MKDVIDEWDSSVWEILHRKMKPGPTVKKVTLKDTLEIVNLFENKEELARYYTPLDIDESGEIKQVQCNHNYGKIVTKLQRREQFKEMIETGKRVELEPYERKQAQPTESCRIQVQIQIYDVERSTGKDLKAELQRHGLSGSGKKEELMTRYRVHLQTEHKEDCDKEREFRCDSHVSVPVDQINFTTVQDLKIELKSHRERPKGKRSDLAAMWWMHLKSYHPDQVHRGEAEEESSEVEMQECESESEKEVQDDSGQDSGIFMDVEEESDSDSDSSSGVVD